MVRGGITDEERSAIPIYEFKCKACDAEFEELVRNDDEEVVCPECSSRKIWKRMSAFAIKSGGKFTPAHGSSCSGCSPSPGGCKSCGH